MVNRMTIAQQMAAARRRGQPLPGDSILGGTVIASVTYRDEFDGPFVPEAERALTDEFTILLLNPSPPYYTVTIITKDDPSQSAWQVIDSYNHMNIVPAINGDMYLENPGYIDMGGDY